MFAAMISVVLKVKIVSKGGPKENRAQVLAPREIVFKKRKYGWVVISQSNFEAAKIPLV